MAKKKTTKPRAKTQKRPARKASKRTPPKRNSAAPRRPAPPRANAKESSKRRNPKPSLVGMLLPIGTIAELAAGAENDFKNLARANPMRRFVTFRRIIAAKPSRGKGTARNPFRQNISKGGR